MNKQIRIDGKTGLIVDADRNTHVTFKDPGGNADTVQWIIVGGSSSVTFTVTFPVSPFLNPPNAQAIPVTKAPGQPTHAVAIKAKGQFADYYKYEVFDSSGNETDDPNIIIES